jgi:SHS2 domain-containing protein
MKYKFLEHTADIKFVAKGKKLKDIFENSVLALSEFISRGTEIKNTTEKRFKISGRNNEELLYNFIDEIIYFLDAESFVPLKSEVKIEEKKKGRIILKAIIFGDKAKNYESLDTLKSATYSEMYIKKDDDGKWEAQIVVDV